MNQNHPPKLYADVIPITLPNVDLITESIRATMRAVAEAINEVSAAAEQAAATLARWGAAHRARLTVAQNDPIHVAGLQGRYGVRAGHLPDEDHLVALVAGILHGTDPGTAWLSSSSRASVVAAALRGWAMAYDGEGPETLAWHRDLGGVRVLVGRAA